MSQIPIHTSIQDLLTHIMPEMTKQEIAARGAAAELTDTEISMVIDVSGETYSYIVKNGSEIQVKAEDMQNPVVRMRISKEDLEKMIATRNLDMITGLMADLNRTKYNALRNMKGSFDAILKNDDGSVYCINAVINGGEAPKSIFKMSAADSSALMKKETNPVNLFMSGAMQIEGDMAFAMATQPLFS